ncbi:MAG TPA: hypothetical protein VMV57_13265 [Terracidiphilus sp.]|nr:hypothetical protein [Terracidiphilus sp.]
MLTNDIVMCKEGGSQFWKPTGKKEVDRDVVVRFPDQKAWILQSPLDVGYDKMSLGRRGCAFKMDKDGDGDLVCRDEEREDASYLDGRVA